MSTVRKLVVTKKPRSDPIPDKPIDFPPLENLHLELIENKRKLKKGLPLIPVKSKPRRQFRPPVKRHEDEKPISQSREKRSKKKKKKKRHHHHEASDDDDADMISQLRAEEDSEVELETDATEDAAEESGDVDDEDIDDEEGEEFSDEDIEEEPEEDEDDPYAGMTPEEREAEEKKEYMWRFRILKKKYKNPTVDIPDFNEHSDLVLMKTSYDRTVRELSLDANVERYRTYLIGGFMLMEFACTQWMGIDLSGFTSQQAQMMNNYEQLLVELGERSYNSWGSNLPVEIRLIGLIIFQAGIFYLGKIITSKFGSTVSDLFRGFTGQPPQPGGGSPTQKPKRKMRGPKIKPEDIRKMAGHGSASTESEDE